MVYNIFLVIHIAAGSLSLLAGPMAILTPKGGWAHRKSGLFFFCSMLVVSATALVLGVLHDIPFLLAVGVFSAYTNITGYRTVYQKKQGRVHQTSRFDWIVSGVMLLCGSYFLFYGIYVLYVRNPFGIVFIFFAQSALRMIWEDWKLFHQRDLLPNTWLIIHLTRMVGTCIAAYTAFAVVNSSSRFSLVGWLLPAMIGIPIRIYWLRKIKPRLTKPVPVEVAA